MKALIQEFEDKYVATLEGELDTNAARDMEKSFQPLYTSNGRNIIIDCTKLEYIASSQRCQDERQQGHHAQHER